MGKRADLRASAAWKRLVSAATLAAYQRADGRCIARVGGRATEAALESVGPKMIRALEVMGRQAEASKDINLAPAKETPGRPRCRTDA